MMPAGEIVKQQNGPCIICGLRNYPLSFGGPDVCPACDCGSYGPQTIKAQKDRIEALERYEKMYQEAVKIQGDAEVIKYVTSGNAIPVTRCTVSADLIRQLVDGRAAAFDRGLEEGAKACESLGDSLNIHNFTIPETGKSASRMCAAAIRARKSKERG